jgi:hypothetical protein
METVRTSRHPIRFTILVAIAAALATIALVLASSGKPAVAASSLNNGNFETGDLTGWTVDTTASGGTASAVASHEYCPAPLECWTIYTILPQEGSYFALLTAGKQSEDTMISQQFEASNGEKVSGWAFFQTTDYILPYDDKAQVVIRSSSGTTVATPFEMSSTGVSETGNNGVWRYWEHTFSGLTGAGTFQIEARVHNTGDSVNPSHIGLDDVKTSIAGPDTTPPETSITSGPARGSSTTSTSATFEFSSNEQGSTFKCQLEKVWPGGGVVEQAWADCTSPKSYSNLSPASYRFEVRATDLAGNADPTPASRDWTIDTTPSTDTTAPTVISTVPTADATGVDRTTNVTATFSEDMLASSINGTTFKLFKQGSTTKLAASVSYPADTATLDPSKSLSIGATYKAVVTSGAKDLAGNQLAQNYSWFFTVGK